ncbi:DUF3626 domain-containing protein [Pseudonocardia nigra]|uniref:DUF3626 domain-containing protein n=1 Tax=Pseudonocardia nigra TaxID=1921578 RepID=UPI001C5F8E36|nr:DUF3626 domain-containing protein [Pseudonocardia nigra]
MGKWAAAALRHVTDRASAAGGIERVRAVLGPDAPVGRLVAGVRRARVTLNFHPDRLLADSRTVVVALDADGRYRSQFETGLSAGSLTAVPGGDRDGWEQVLFGGAYRDRWVDRPCYGGLNLLAHPDGACPRFGSCHLRLRAAVLDRCTFCAGDSHLGPVDVGTLAAFEPVLAALVEAAAAGVVLGSRVDLPALARLLLTGERPPGTGVVPGRALDDYVEAQVHGGVDLTTDVEAVVADPSFRGTDVGARLERLAARRGLPLEWHPGFELAADAVPPEFRGPAVADFALRVQRAFGVPGAALDAALLGRTAAALPRDPETLQLLKRLWHVLVAFGRPCRT